MKQKGVYMYDFMDSFEKFYKTELPSKEEFRKHRTSWRADVFVLPA